MSELSLDGLCEAPSLFQLSRRDFLKWAGVAGLAAAAESAAQTAPPASTESPAKEVATAQQRSGKVFSLPNRPNPNPGYLARDLGGEGLLLWTQQADGSPRAFRLNSSGRTVWRLCDGARSAGDVAREYARQTGRPGVEAETFLAELSAAGVVRSGGGIVAAPGFALPPAGGSYHLRLRPDDPPET